MNTLSELTFADLCKTEPRLGELYIKVHLLSQRHMNSSEVENTWYRDIKPAMVKLVGYNSEHLRKSASYDIAYQTLFNALSRENNG